MKYPIICSFLLTTSFTTLSFVAHAQTQTCQDNAVTIVEQMQVSGDFNTMTAREIKIATRAAMAACDETFAKLETQLEAAKNAPETDKGVDPSHDPIGWLKEQWHKESPKKKGLERLERRR